jgi:hypothetical protein
VRGSEENIGLHFQAAQAIAEYIEKAGLTSGPLFRPRLNSRQRETRKRRHEPVDDLAGG